MAQCGNSYIGDFVWHDLNGNGVQDAGEPGINGVQVTLVFPDGTTAVETTHNYNGAGYYDFKNLGPGTYKLIFPTTIDSLRASPSNRGENDGKDSDPVNGVAFTTIKANQSDFTIDAGYTNKTYTPPPPPFAGNCLSLGNMVFYDANDNGMKDRNEMGIAEAHVYLYKDNDGNNTPDSAAIAHIMTAQDGTYLFTNLADGKYIVGVQNPSGYLHSTPVFSNPNTDIDNDNNGVRTITGNIVISNFITLTAGGEPINDGSDNSSNTTLDFGFKMVSTPCTDHCDCHNNCTHTGCGHSNCGSIARVGNPGRLLEESRTAPEATASLAKNAISVYPNPTLNVFTLLFNSEDEGIATVRIIDIAGKVVSSKKINVRSGDNRIVFRDLENAQAGTYNLEMVLNEKVKTQKIMLLNK
jgi:hypothetical protein